MDDTILLGRGSQLIPLPRQQWEHNLAAVPAHQQARLGFMTLEHHRIRSFVVEQLPKAGVPLAPETIARALALPLARVSSLLAELERELVFLVRDAQGDVAWALPVTVEQTPHRLTFSSGERVYAA